MLRHFSRNIKRGKDKQAHPSPNTPQLDKYFPNPFRIQTDIKNRIDQFAERRLKRHGLVDENKKPILFYDEFYGKQHEFEVYMRDQEMFATKIAKEIQI
jgi:hypothetical protein